MAKKPLERVIADLKASHPNDGYDYSLITEENYIDTHHNVPIVCKKHGVFFQTPHAHLRRGCKACGYESMQAKVKGKTKEDNRSKIFNFGVFDVKTAVSDIKISTPYRLWVGMIRRCYDTKYNKDSYSDCCVCDEWKYFSNFLTWFNIHKEEYQEQYQLDKDILVKGNRIYSPDTCCFVPKFINTLLLKGQKKRVSKNGDCPLGVTYYCNKYSSRISIRGKIETIGYFFTPEEAFTAYKTAKEAYIKEVAQEYYDAGKITKRVYSALMNYKVEITD